MGGGQILSSPSSPSSLEKAKFFTLEGRLRAEHGVQRMKELSHHGDIGLHGCLSSRQELVVEGFDVSIPLELDGRYPQKVCK